MNSFAAALKDRRLGRGLSLRQMAKQVHCSHAHVADLESGRRKPGQTLAEQLDQVLGAGGELVALAGHADDAGGLAFRSHKLVTGHVSPSAVEALCGGTPAVDRIGHLGTHTALTIICEQMTVDLHVWPHGSVIAHAVEDAAWESIGEFAEWRYRTYDRNLDWFSGELVRLTGQKPESPYVFSFYWVEQTPWPSDQLASALRLISVPRALVGADGADRQRESELLAKGFNDEGIRSFGVAGSGSGYASWSGVVYHPHEPGVGLAENDLLTMEFAVQSVWAFCSSVARDVERGGDPELRPGVDWRWLRGLRSRLVVARAQEDSHHRAMREALLETSGLLSMMDETVDILKECDR